MLVITAQEMGMCFGVRDALAVARSLEHPAQVTIFGQLVHNPLVARELECRGFERLEEDLRQTRAIGTPRVLITAHGISDRQRGELRALGKTLIDTTCPLVKKAHGAALALDRAGYFVVIIGKPDHVEVRGLAGDLTPGRHDIVETVACVHRYAPVPQRIGIIAQTTTVEHEARLIVARIRDLNPQADEVRFVNTICRPTRDRQDALESLLGQVDVLVAVGGHHSNNTRQLVARASLAGVRALHVEDAGELSDDMFLGHEIVGLTAGTSTLPETIEAVRLRLEEMHPATRALRNAAHQNA